MNKPTLPVSVLNTTTTKKRMGPYDIGDGEVMAVNVRWDDTCKNGHNTFAITCDIYKNRRDVGGGAAHELIAKYVPELVDPIKYHLVSSDGPMHYIANSMYHAKEGKLDAARSSAVWPEAELEDFTEEKLLARLPKLMEEFKTMVESLGFTY